METIKSIWFDSERIYMLSSEDKVYSRPLEAFPVLKDATDTQRSSFEIVLRGKALRWVDFDEDIHISSFYEDKEPKYDNEVAHIFRRFPQLNVSEVARSWGINKSLLVKYIYGIEHPSEERIRKIKVALHALGKELIAV